MGALTPGKIFTKPLTPISLSEKKPTTMVLLSGITQNNKETLKEYINHFTKVSLHVGGIDDGLNCWIFERGLRIE